MSYSKFDLKMYTNQPIDDKGTLPITFTSEEGFTIQDEHGVICHWEAKEFDEYENAFATALNMAMVYIQEGADVLRWQIDSPHTESDSTAQAASPDIASLRGERQKEIKKEGQVSLRENTQDLARHIHCILTGETFPEALRWYLVEYGPTEVVFEPLLQAISLSYPEYTTYKRKPVDCDLLLIEMKRLFHNFEFYGITIELDRTKVLFPIEDQAFENDLPVYYGEIMKDYEVYLESKKATEPTSSVFYPPSISDSNESK